MSYLKQPKLDDLRDLLYRLDHLKDPDQRFRQTLIQEIERCKDLSADDRSTNAPAPASSTRKPDSPKQLTLA